jgi:hypothetical protein
MPLETVRDNQWWYTQSVHRQQVENCAFIVLSIGGRECPLSHSETGRDGRPTHSFKFLDPTDREFWVGLRANQVDIELIECGDQVPELNRADEDDHVDEPGGQQLLEMPPVSRSSETLFDAYVFIDWSASSRPKIGADSIWIGAGAFDATGTLIVDQPINPRTRNLAETNVRDLLLGHTQANRRVLVGFDFPYGYPSNWHIAIGQVAGNWKTLWNLLNERITDDAENANNRCKIANDLNAAVADFPGPFWSRPNCDAMLYPALPANKPLCFENGVAEFRQIEEQLRQTGKHPKSVWQLFGNGVVASQSLLGIPVLHRLRQHERLREYSHVWPFETGWKCPVGQRPSVVHAEIWPGAIPVTRGLHAIKDAAQVLSYVYWAARLDVSGLLQGRFNPHVNPHGAVPPAVVEQCEGWILG